MGTGYEINVAKNGKHYFATTLRSCQTETQAQILYRDLKEKYPEEEGYTVTVEYWTEVGHKVNFS